jgi:hypothetical protein
MLRSALICALFALAAWPAYAAQEEVIAIVDLKFIRDTGKPAGYLCFGDQESDCSVHATYYLWQATVRKILRGEESQKRFLVLYGRHALVRKDLRRQTVVLKRLDADAMAGARYEVVDVGRHLELVCFRRPIGGEGVRNLSESGSEPQSCLSSDPE